MRTQCTVRGLNWLAILLSLLALGLIAEAASMTGGPGLDALSPARTLESVCREPGAYPSEPTAREEPRPFGCGTGEASGEHNLP